MTIANTATSPISTASFFTAKSHSPRLVIRLTLTAMLAIATNEKAVIPTAHPRVRRRTTPWSPPKTPRATQAATITATKKRSKSELNGSLMLRWIASIGTRKIAATNPAISQGRGLLVRGQASPLTTP